MVDGAAGNPDNRCTALLAYLPWDLLLAIDESRGKRSREEFVALCVKVALRDEKRFLELQDETSLVEEALWQNRSRRKREPLMVERGEGASLPELGRHKESIGSATSITWSQTAVERRLCQVGEKRSDDDEHSKRRSLPGEEFVSEPMYKKLWYLAVLTFGLGDLLTTIVALNLGLTELNPIVDHFQSIPGLLLFKTAIMTGLFLFSYAGLRSRIAAYSAPAITTLVGVSLIINNIFRTLQAVG